MEESRILFSLIFSFHKNNRQAAIKGRFPKKGNKKCFKNLNDENYRNSCSSVAVVSVKSSFSKVLKVVVLKGNSIHFECFF